MIAKISGTVSDTLGDAVIIDVAGVGYLVHVSLDTKTRLGGVGAEASLFTHLAVRENSLDLYGFLETRELSFFEKLISISGVGPKTALGILSLADVDTLTAAVRTGDTSYLTKVSGIGKKSAERIVLELRDKLDATDDSQPTTGNTDDVDVLEALTSLGYPAKDARDALKQVPADASGTSERLKQALQFLSNGK